MANSLRYDETTGTFTNAVQVTGSIPEYGWVDGDTEPTPTGFAFGVKINPTTGAMTTMYYNGTAWSEVSV